MCRGSHARVTQRAKGGESGLTYVVIGDGDSLDRALRRFKRQVQRAGVFGDLRRKKYYEKPSEARKRKMAAARRRARRHGRA